MEGTRQSNSNSNTFMNNEKFERAKSMEFLLRQASRARADYPAFDTWYINEDGCEDN